MSTNIKQDLKNLVNYYEHNRQVGHTELMLNGVVNTDKSIVLSHSFAYCKCIDKRIGRKNFTNDITMYGSTEYLVAHDEPLAIDNAMLHMLFSAALKEIESLEKKIEDRDIHYQQDNIKPLDWTFVPGSSEVNPRWVSISGDGTIYEAINTADNRWNAYVANGTKGAYVNAETAETAMAWLNMQHEIRILNCLNKKETA